MWIRFRRYAQSDMNDLKFALRQLRKSPGFTLVAVITIALGIGATTAIFTVVDATLLEPLPYPQAEQLVTIQDDLPGLGARDVGMSQPEWEDLQRSGIFEYVSPTWFDENNLTGSEQPAANLLLARASTRGREMALRQALGANRARLMQQLLTESLLLSLLGGVGGLAVLFAVKDLLLRFVPDNLPRLNEISISWTVLLFALCASVFSGVIFGLAPAFQASRLDLQQALKQEGQGSVGSAQRARTRRGLVITEFALSLVLMI